MERAAMDDHQFATAAREHLGAATNAEAYEELLGTCDVARDRSIEEIAKTRDELAKANDELAQVRSALSLVRGARDTEKAAVVGTIETPIPAIGSEK